MLLVAILFFVFLAAGMPIAYAMGIAGMAFFSSTPNCPLHGSPTSNFANAKLYTARGTSFHYRGQPHECLWHYDATHQASLGADGTHAWGPWPGQCRALDAHGRRFRFAIADASMEARILAPAMIKQGYSPGFTANCTAWTALITATIPPGVGIILYGTTGEVSIGKLFAAGIFVGLFLMIVYMTTVWLISRQRGYKPERERASFRERLIAIKDNIWALMFPVLLLVGLRIGIFTPSEVGSFACVYAILVGVFAYKELTLKKLMQTLASSVLDAGGIMFIIALCGIFGYGIPFERIPDLLSGAILGLSMNRYIVMLIIIAILLILGMFIDGSVVILLFTPIFLPLAVKVGWDPVHFGILFCTIITAGNMTPPVGLAMSAVCTVLNVPISEYIKEMWPWLLATVLAVSVLIFFPNLVLALPRLLF